MSKAHRPIVGKATKIPKTKEQPIPTPLPTPLPKPAPVKGKPGPDNEYSANTRMHVYEDYG